MKILEPKAGNPCFGCGDDNPFGLKLSFQGDPQAGTAWTEFEAPTFLSGSAGIMHGGFISLLLDEVSSKVLSMLDKRGLTRTLDVSFEKTVPLGKPIRLEARLLEQDGRKHFIEAKILNSDGEALATSKALFLVFGTTASGHNQSPK